MSEEKTSVVEIVPNIEVVTISSERYEQLIKAETKLEMCKNVITGSVSSYDYDKYFCSILGIKDGENDGAE